MIQLPLERLESFVVRAKAATYAGKGIKTPPYRPEAYELQYREEDFFYIDSYFGGADFIGQETVYFAGKPVWAMNYYGRLLEPVQISSVDAGLIIQESLTALYLEGRFLGGFCHTTSNGIYHDESQGDFRSFTGREWINRSDERVYELVYHGGLIKE